MCLAGLWGGDVLFSLSFIFQSYLLCQFLQTPISDEQKVLSLSNVCLVRHLPRECEKGFQVPPWLEGIQTHSSCVRICTTVDTTWTPD